MRVVRNGICSLFVMMLMMSLLVLAAPNAEAVPAGPECDEGQLVGAQCLVDVGPPVTGPAQCPVSDTVFEDGADCYELVATVDECVAGTNPDGAQCRLLVDRVPGSLTCADGLELIDGSCFGSEEAQIELGCLGDGVLEGEVCIIEGPPPVPGPGQCPVSDTVFEDGAECYELVPAVLGDCPAGTVADPGGDCREGVDLVPGDLSCPDGFGLIDGECVQVVDATFVMVCEVGDVVGELCVLEGDAPIQGPAVCPVSDTVLQDGSECYTLISAIQDATCAAPYVQFGATCRANNTGDDPISVAEFSCPSAPVDVVVREITTELDGIVIIESCEYDVFVTLSCPAGTVPEADPTLCRRPVDLRPGGFVCTQDGYDLVNSQCLLISTPVLQAQCVEGTVSGDLCVIVGGPPVPGPATCPVSATVFLDGNFCYRLIAAPNECPTGTVDDIETDECRQSVNREPGVLECVDGFAYDEASERCIAQDDPTQVLTCESGDLIDGGTTCVFEGAAPVSGPAECPVSDTVFEDGAECYTLVDPQSVCPVDTVADASGQCRASVDRVPGTGDCAEGETLVDGSCFALVDAVFRCNGLDVTINMRRGDSGVGTSGDDVVLGTSAADLIRTGAGNDVICASGGDDNIHAGQGDDVVFGGTGNDRIRGNQGDDVLRGGGDDDDVRGGSGNDTVLGNQGNDRVHGDGDDDTVRGGSGNDTVLGGSGDDRALGDAGDDTVRGGTGNDDVRGGAGDDRVFGNSGNDDLNGGSGLDECSGGPGDDTPTPSCEVTRD